MESKTIQKARELIEQGKVDLYSKNSPRWILEDDDTLIWSGIGGSVELDLKEVYNACILAKRVIEEKRKLEARHSSQA